jgi:hypothetical protein
VSKNTNREAKGNGCNEVLVQCQVFLFFVKASTVVLIPAGSRYLLTRQFVDWGFGVVTKRRWNKCGSSLNSQQIALNPAPYAD